MSRFDQLIPYFKQVLNEYPDIQKNDLINLVKITINEWKDKPSFSLINEIENLSEDVFIMIMFNIGVSAKQTFVYSVSEQK